MGIEEHITLVFEKASKKFRASEVDQETAGARCGAGDGVSGRYAGGCGDKNGADGTNESEWDFGLRRSFGQYFDCEKHVNSHCCKPILDCCRQPAAL